MHSSPSSRRIGSVKAPKLADIWAEPPCAEFGTVLKKDIRAEMLNRAVKVQA